MIYKEISWNIHPGEILKHEFMEPLNLNASQLAKHLGVSIPRINDILLERRGITASTALRLAKVLNTSPHFWMNMQAAYELREAEKKMIHQIESLVPLPTQNDEHVL